MLEVAEYRFITDISIDLSSNISKQALMPEKRIERSVTDGTIEYRVILQSEKISRKCGVKSVRVMFSEKIEFEN